MPTLWKLPHILKYDENYRGKVGMSTRLIIEGNSVYEIDEDCLACSEKLAREKKEAGRRTGDKIEHRGPQGRRDNNGR